MKTETIFIKRSKAVEQIATSHGKKFWVKFRKKDNSIRDMEAEVRPPKPDPKRPSPVAWNPDLILVGDRQVYHQLKDSGVTEDKAYNDSYRCITISQLLEFKIENVNYIVEDDENG